MDRLYGTAIVLAGGSGKRMGTSTHKQYLLLQGHPVLFYSLETFQKSKWIDEIILVTGSGEEEYCRREIVERYGLDKVSRIVPGGAERYHSVWNGLQAARDEGVVYIHDGARPFVDEEMLQRAYDCVKEYHACAAGMPVKDTIKIVDQNQNVEQTPDRNRLWMVQTPQVFDMQLVKHAYGELMKRQVEGVTDDAMVVEKMTGHTVRLFEGSYKNIKITTPEDLDIAGLFLKRKRVSITT